MVLFHHVSTSSLLPPPPPLQRAMVHWSCVLFSPFRALVHWGSRPFVGSLALLTVHTMLVALLRVCAFSVPHLSAAALCALVHHW